MNIFSQECTDGLFQMFLGIKVFQRESENALDSGDSRKAKPSP